MDLVKLEIDGKKVIADGRQTILEVAREHGIGDIPTLCHDDQLEPFASCFVCVVKVKGARTLLPACSTRIAAGMVVETNSAEVRRSRKAALELILTNHYADCVGPCQLACPAGIDIQGYVALAALGKYNDAIALIKDRNPLPAVCGRVCTRPCEVKGCRRNLVDDAVGIDYIKRYLADVDLGNIQPFRPKLAPANGKRIAIVGAGPGGLSCAYYLAIRGYAVEVFEAMPEAGGMLRYGIPEYRLPKEILDLEINQILDLGVRLHTNVAAGRDFTVSSLKQDGFDAVFMAIGAWESSRMRVADEDGPGVLPGIDFLRDYGLHRAQRLSGTVLVVGGGNTAIDCARTALRLGAAQVRLLYRRTRAEMPANEMEIVEAEHEGIQMDFLVAPTRVVRGADGTVEGIEVQKMELGAPDASGRRSPKPVRGSEYVIPGATVIAAIGQNTHIAQFLGGKVPNFLPFGESMGLTRWQTIQVNEKTFETTVDGVFAGGDVVTGAATAIEAIAAGRKAAYALDAYVRTGRAEPEPTPFNSRKDTFRKIEPQDLRPAPLSHKRPMPTLPAGERTKSFVEVEQGYSLQDMKLESERCLECGCQALFSCDLRKFATEYGVDIQPFLGAANRYELDRTHPLMELDPNKCILCGRCVRMCSEVVGVGAYGFVNRGFGTIVRPALGVSLLDTDCVTCGLCIGTCPTGAIVEKVPLKKPGPWATVPVPTVCESCGTGCRLNNETFGESLIRRSRSEDDHTTAGLHCRHGRFGTTHVHSQERLAQGAIRAGRELQRTPVEEALRFAAIRLKELKRKHTGDEMAVFVSPRLTNEEAYLAQKFARIVLGTHQVTSFARLVNQGFDCPEVVSTATYRDVVDAQSIVVVNSNTDEEHFVVDLLAKKALRQGGRMIYVGPHQGRTSRFAEVVLPCADGDQARVIGALVAAVRGETPGPVAGVAPEDLAAAAAILTGSLLKVLVFNKDYRGLRVPGDERLFAEAAQAFGASLLALREKANMQGLLDVGVSPGWLPGYVALDDSAGVAALEREWCVSLSPVEGAHGDVAARLRQKKIKVAIVLGEDPLGEPGFPRDLVDGLCAAEFLCVGDLFMTPTASAAHVLLPLSSSAETGGTMTNQERRVQRLERAVPPRSGLESWQVISQLAALMGFRFRMKYTSAADVTGEIRRAVPLYAAVNVDSADADGTWDLGAFPLPAVPWDPRRLDAPAATVRTAGLDTLETRFRERFEQLDREARAALAPA